VWVPTNTGGILTIQYKTGKVDLRRPFKKVIKPAASEIVHEVKPGESGEYFVIAKGKAGDRVLCTFVQTAFSRDGMGASDPALIPWNFWYWPTSSSPNNKYGTAAGDVMARYARAFGHDPEACRAAERTDHKSKAVARAPFYDWQGHCHMAAPAAAIFEEPEGLTFNNEFFTADELKLLAAEYFGNFGDYGEMIWELKRGPAKIGGDAARWYLPGYFKPGDLTKGSGEFIRGLKYEFREGQSWDDPKLNEFAETIANGYIAHLGGPDKFQEQLDDWFGELAAEFYQALIDAMLTKKHPLMANMRAYNPNAGPDQVWNQVYFWYQA